MWRVLLGVKTTLYRVLISPSLFKGCRKSKHFLKNLGRWPPASIRRHPDIHQTWLKAQCCPLTTHTQAMASGFSVSQFQNIHQTWVWAQCFPLYNTYISHDLKGQCCPRFKTYKGREARLSVSPFTTHTKDINQGSMLSHFNTYTRHNIRAHYCP